jgi:hypothetical protein
MSFSSSSTRPALRSTRPKIAFIAVDLPAPFGPTIATTWPTPARSATSVTTGTRP